MLTKDGIDVPINALTPENYLVPKGEEMVYHCVIEVVQFNPKTGVRISRPRVQKFGRKIFEHTVRDALLKQGYTVKILYNPTEWIKAKKNQVAQHRANAEARRKAEIDAAVQAAVAKALAEVKTKTESAPKTTRKKKSEETEKEQ